jgi:hypothetical protein
MSIALPAALEDAVRRRAAEAGMTPEDYLAALVERDQDDDVGLTEEQRRRIGNVVLKRLNDGRPRDRADPAFWQDFFRRAEETHAARRAP